MKIVSDVGPWSIVPEWVLDSEVSDRAVRLYALLGRYADANGESFAGRKTLAERLRCSLDSVDRAVDELVKAGGLTVEQRRRDTGGLTTNLYTLRAVSPTPSRNGAATPSRTRAEGKNESQKERETSMAAAPRERPRNEIWDALAEVFGEPTTPSATRVRGKVAAELAVAGATPSGIIQRARTWPQHFENATLTDLAFAKHYDTLGRKPLRRQR